jgi:hypothetical protein
MSLTPFQIGGEEQRGVGCQVEPGFIQEGIYRHVASSDNEKIFLHNLEHSLSR